ncbi:MAG: putative ABC transporter permease [Oscillospiraceae bacterium]
MKLKFPNIDEIEERQKQENHFAKGCNFYKLFWIFFVGCFLGVVVETIWCIVVHHKFESRVGLIYGPFNLVYGFGALAMVLGLNWMRKRRDFWILLAGTVIGTIVEYICSFVQQSAFGSLSWDYSEFTVNIFGRVSLLYSLFWGILAIVWVRWIYPLMVNGISKIPNKVGKILTWVLLVFMVFNTVMSGLAVKRWEMRILGDAPTSSVWEFFDTHYPNEKMKKIYANMSFQD